MVDRSLAISYLRSIMTGNKALGLLAQVEFENWISEQPGNVSNKYFSGCWILSPRNGVPNQRICFFTHDTIVEPDDVVSITQRLSSDRTFHSMCSSLVRAGLGVVYSFPVCTEEVSNLNNLDWLLFRYNEERLTLLNADGFFTSWPRRGRRGTGGPWTDHVNSRYEELDEENLESLLLNQAFYSSFIKTRYRLTISDPYDADGFIISYSGNVFPLEMKEKYPFETNTGLRLGIDVGRILMLIRICLPLNSNAMYIVREVTNTDDRDFIGWKMVRLDTILLKSYWQGIGGGTGMTGGATQTITMPYDAYEDITTETISEDSLNQVSQMSDVVRAQANVFRREVEKLFQSSNQGRHQRTLI